MRSMPCLLAAVCYSCGGTVESAVFCFVLFFTLMVAVYADQISLSRWNWNMGHCPCSRSIGKQMNKLVLHAVGAAVILKSLTKVQKTCDKLHIFECNNTVYYYTSYYLLGRFVFLLLRLTDYFSFCRVDPFSKKDWYDVKAPSMFAVRQIGKTLVTRTQGTSRF